MQQYVNVIADDRQTQEINNNVSRVFSSLYSNPLLNNPVIVKGLLFSSGTDLLVNHKLNRAVTGYIVINSNAAVNVYQSSTVNLQPKAQIILKTNATATVDILFF
jgi:hypothetical protein